MDHRTCRTWRQPRSKTCDCTETSRAPGRPPTSSLSSGNHRNLKLILRGITIWACCSSDPLYIGFRGGSRISRLRKTPTLYFLSIKNYQFPKNGLPQKFRNGI